MEKTLFILFALWLKKYVIRSQASFQNIDQRYTGFGRSEIMIGFAIYFRAAGFAFVAVVVHVHIPESEGGFDSPTRR